MNITGRQPVLPASDKRYHSGSFESGKHLDMK